MKLQHAVFDTRLATAVFLGFAFVFLYLSLFILPATPLFYENDHFIQMYDSVRMLDGELMYKDFFQFTFPGTEIWYLVWFKLFGDRIWIVNATIVILGLSIAWTLLEMSRRCISGVYAFIAPSLFLFFGFRWYGMDGGHRLFSCLFALLAILVLMRGVSFARLVAAGAFAALSALFTQNRGLGVCAGVTIYLVWHFLFAGEGRRWSDLVKSWFVFGAAFGASLFAMLGYFLATAGVANFFQSTILFATNYSSDPVNNSNLYVGFWRDLFAGRFTPITVLNDLFYYLLAPAVYLIPPVYYFLRRDVDRELRRQVLLMCAVGIMLFMATSGLNQARLYHVAMPGLVVLAVWWSRAAWRKVLLAGVGLCVVEAVALCGWGQVRSYPAAVQMPTGTAVFTSEMAGERYVWLNDRTDPGDVVFEPYRTVVNFPLRLRNPTSFATLRDNNYTTAPQVALITSELNARPPKFILWDGKWTRPASERAADDNLAPLYQFMTENYHLKQRLTPIFGMDVEAWERNDAAAEAGK